ncbi:fasciclin domain-containing protein [Paraflavisolibacter sp. H34]|uniref:fasciclin domain-containing protein n=1 Tax=Huijunlia imazamoxiresistens TaxID=3127457 RepID=UPI003015B75E
MRIQLCKALLALMGTGLFFTGCNKWEDATSLESPAAANDLLVQIRQHPELSRFAELLVQTGYDRVVASSRSFTVFAPTNAALASLDPAILGDSVRLRQLVGNHITTQLFPVRAAAGPLRLQMLNGKYQNLQGSTFEEATITKGDNYARNGLLHLIDKVVPVLPNAWESLEGGTGMPTAQRDYLFSLGRRVFDPSRAVQTGVDSVGNPVYQPGTDSVSTNLFWNRVHDLRHEQEQFTVFLLADDAWEAEVARYNSFFITGTADSTRDLSRWAVARDLVVEGRYEPGTLPDTLLSKFHAKMGIDRSAIAQTIRTSNGLIHIMNRLEVRPKDKFGPYLIQAENYRTASADRRGNTYLRDRVNPMTGKPFRDVLVYNHGLALFNLGYRLSEVPSGKYRAYWVALNDNINNMAGSNASFSFSQKLGIGSPTSALLPYVPVTLRNYNEVYLGEFTLSQYYPVLDVFLTAANSGAANVNPLVCDYIRIEPVF